VGFIMFLYKSELTQLYYKLRIFPENISVLKILNFDISK
jgi:hypothetical protein